MANSSGGRPRGRTRGLALSLVTLLGASACATTSSLDNLVARNGAALGELAVGMTRAEAVETMESKTYYVSEPGWLGFRVENPYRVVVLDRDSGPPDELLYYYTKHGRDDGAVTRAEITPLVLENDHLVGWGWDVVDQRYDADRVRTAEAAAAAQARQDRHARMRHRGVDPAEREFYEAVGRGSYLGKLGAALSSGAF